jgi:CHAT domain-containing protein/Tfp pilus assembly protein PilF
MEHESKNEALLRKYLLGDLSEADEQVFEEQVLADEELLDLLLAEEDELIDDYLGGGLSARERERFEAHFLSTPERFRCLNFGRALSRYGERMSYETSVNENRAPQENTQEAKREDPRQYAAIKPISKQSASHVDRKRTAPTFWLRVARSPYFAYPIAAVIMIGVVLWIWRGSSSKSQLDEGLSALSRAYSAERPIEARLTGLGYARYADRRSGEDLQNIDVESLLLAEATLLNEVAKRPSAAAYNALGEVYLSKRNYKTAIEYFEKALNIEPDNTKFENDYGAALFEMGKVEGDRGKGLELISQGCEHLKRAAALNDTLLEALFNLALCHLEMNMNDEAEGEWRKYLEKDPNSKWADEARNRLAELERKKQKTALSEEQLFQNFVTAYRSKDDVNAWHMLRRTRARKGNLITARLLRSYLEVLEKPSTALAESYLQMISYAGVLEERNAQDKFTKDLASYYKLLAPAHGRKLIEAHRIMKTASDIYEKEEYGESSRMYSKASSLFARTGNFTEVILCDFWTGIASLRTDPRKSLSILEPLSRICEKRGYKYLLLHSLNGLADAKSTLRLVSEALDIGARALVLSQELEDPNGMLRSVMIPVGIYQRLGEYRLSLGYVLKGFAIAESFSPEAYEVWPLYHQAAFSLYSLGRLVAALEYQQKALQVAIESNLPFLKSRSYARLGLINEKLQRPNDAISNCELALAESENIENRKSRDNIRGNSILLLAHVYRQRGELARAAAYYDQALELHRGLKIENYLFETHHGKLAALVGLNDDRVTEAEIETALEVVEQYRSGISDDTSRNSFFDLAQSIYDLAIDFSYSRLQKPELAFNHAESSHARSLLDLMRMAASDPPKRVSVTASMSLQEIWDRMPENSQIIEFSVLDTRTLAWVISKGRIDCKETAVSAAALESLVQRFRDLLGNPVQDDSQTLQQVARELYKLLITRTEELLKPNSYLCIVPDSFLGYVPFAALVSPDTGNYFVEERVFGFAPSATIFVESTQDARRKAKTEPEKMMAVGNPAFDLTRFRDLPSAAEEVANIKQFYTAPLGLCGEDATESRVKAEMKRADVIELATHYVADRQSPLKSGLLLASKARDSQSTEDGYLRASEIYEMKLPRTRLVVLSACQTAIERAYRGEGAIGIARPFLKVRVPLVVASLWAVDSGSTSQLMTRLHRNRTQATGVSTAEALCGAQREMLNGPNENWRHPYYWAPFALIGGYARF